MALAIVRRRDGTCGGPISNSTHRFPKMALIRSDYRAAKFGSWERSRALDSRLIAVGRAEGIPFSFGKIGRTPDTLDAYRFIRLADL